MPYAQHAWRLWPVCFLRPTSDFRRERCWRRFLAFSPCVHLLFLIFWGRPFSVLKVGQHSYLLPFSLSLRLRSLLMLAPMLLLLLILLRLLLVAPLWTLCCHRCAPFLSYPTCGHSHLGLWSRPNFVRRYLLTEASRFGVGVVIIVAVRCGVMKTLLGRKKFFPRLRSLRLRKKDIDGVLVTVKARFSPTRPKIF